jgi:hypothetical protein
MASQHRPQPRAARLSCSVFHSPDWRQPESVLRCPRLNLPKLPSAALHSPVPQFPADCHSAPGPQSHWESRLFLAVQRCLRPEPLPKSVQSRLPQCCRHPTPFPELRSPAPHCCYLRALAHYLPEPVLPQACCCPQSAS